MTDDKCKAEFRFLKNDIHLPGEVLNIPDIMKCLSGVLLDVVEALSGLLKRLYTLVDLLDWGDQFQTLNDYKPNYSLCIQ